MKFFRNICENAASTPRMSALSVVSNISIPFAVLSSSFLMYTAASRAVFPALRE